MSSQSAQASASPSEGHLPDCTLRDHADNATRHHQSLGRVFGPFCESAQKGKFQQIVTPRAMLFLDFATLQLNDCGSHSLQTGARKYMLDIFSGSVTLADSTPGHGQEISSNVGNRADIFSGPP